MTMIPQKQTDWQALIEHWIAEATRAEKQGIDVYKDFIVPGLNIPPTLELLRNWQQEGETAPLFDRRFRWLKYSLRAIRNIIWERGKFNN